MKNSSFFFYENWLRNGFHWKSPYHDIAFRAATKLFPSTAHLLLDHGFLTRAADLLSSSSSNAKLLTAQARVAYLSGDHASATAYSFAALDSRTDAADQRRVVKLLARISPNELIAWLDRGDKHDLALRIRAARDDAETGGLLFPQPTGDERLLNANRNRNSAEKLFILNSFWEEMGLSSIKLRSDTPEFDINCFLNSRADHQVSLAETADVSVVMAVHNGAAYIESSCMSILNQLGILSELIVIDDGSTDNTWEILEELKQRYEGRVMCKRLEQNIGTYKAKNIALKMCRREYIAFQDADDWSHPERLSTAIKWLRSDSQNVAVTSRYVRLDKNGVFSSPAVWPIRQWSPNTLVMRRKEVIEKVGIFDEVSVGADTDYFERIRATFGDRRINFQKEVMLIAMKLPSSLMHNKTTGISQNGYSAPRIAYREKSAERLLHCISHRRDPHHDNLL